MNIEEVLKHGIQKAFKDIYDAEIKTGDIKIQPTNKEFEGSHTFVVFPFLRITRKSPEESGTSIGQYLHDKLEIIEKSNVVKGFLNLTIDDKAWLKVFDSIIAEKNWGVLPETGNKVIVEYSSPNTNKPLHLGHMRNNFLGYSVSKILSAAGSDVLKVTLVNDRGIHICKSMVAYKRFGQNETPDSAGIKGDHLVGTYYVKFDKEHKKQVKKLIEEGTKKEEAEKTTSLLLEAQDMLKKWEQKDEEVIGLWKQMNQWVYNGFDATYKMIGVDFDKTLFESETYLLGKDMVDEGLQKKVFFTKEDGSVWADLSDEGLDEKLLLRSDGTSVYITQDLGTADLKYEIYPFNESIYVVGNEQDYHFDVLFKLLKKLGRPYDQGLYHLSYGMVDLPSGKMKSREGTVVDADDLMEEMIATAKRHTEELGKIEEFTEEQANDLYKVLALGALKYFLLKIDPKRRMLFNPEESVQFQGNTGPFIQYTHARISSVLRKAQQIGIQYLDQSYADISTLMPAESTLVNILSEYPEKVKEAAKEHAPSVIANYVYDLAKEFNRFYTELSILKEENPTIKNFRLALSYMTAQTINKGMGLLGIEVPERM